MNSFQEIPGITLTMARYPLAEYVAKKVKDRESATLGMLVLITADIYDGKFLRRFNADTPTRRVADGVVDQISIFRMGYAVYRQHPEVQLPLKLMAMRALAVGAINLAHYLKTGEVTKGGKCQKVSNLAIAACIVSAARDSESQVRQVSWIAAGVSATTGLASLKGFGKQHDGKIRQL